jgi:predicted metalloprotease
MPTGIDRNATARAAQAGSKPTAHNGGVSSVALVVLILLRQISRPETLTELIDTTQHRQHQQDRRTVMEMETRQTRTRDKATEKAKAPCASSITN